MKRNTLLGMFFIGAVALSSCSTQNKLASPQAEDDVYFTKAKAGEAPVYAAATTDSYKRDYSSPQNRNNNGYDDYYAYDSYSARLNRFYSYSPYVSSYYSDFWYGGNPYYTGLSLGLSFGSGYYGGLYSYSPYTGYGNYGYNSYYNNPYYAYNPYGYGSLYGYGSSQYWGVNSYYNSVPYNGTPRPNRNGTGIAYNNGGSSVYYGGYPTPTPATQRPVRVATTNPANGNTNGNTATTSRPVRTQDPQPQPTYTRPTYTPQPQTQSQPQSYPSSSGSSSSGSSSSGSSSSGARPVRP